MCMAFLPTNLSGSEWPRHATHNCRAWQITTRLLLLRDVATRSSLCIENNEAPGKAGISVVALALSSNTVATGWELRRGEVRRRLGRPHCRLNHISETLSQLITWYTQWRSRAIRPWRLARMTPCPWSRGEATISQTKSSHETLATGVSLPFTGWRS